MNILSVILCIAVVAFTAWQTILLIKDIRRKRKQKKQNVIEKESNENDNSN